MGLHRQWPPPRRCQLPSRTIATLVIPIGRLAGARTRRSGAVPRSRWAARRLRPSHTTATLVILIGRLVGVQTRRSGAAPTRRWGARRSVAIEHPAPDHKGCKGEEPE